MNKNSFNSISLSNSLFNSCKKVLPEINLNTENFFNGSKITIASIALCSSLNASSIDGIDLSKEELTKQIIEKTTITNYDIKNNNMNGILTKTGEMSKEDRNVIMKAYNSYLPLKNFDTPSEYSLSFLNKLLDSDYSSIQEVSEKVSLETLEDKGKEFKNSLKHLGVSGESIQILENQFERIGKSLYSDASKGYENINYSSWGIPNYEALASSSLSLVLEDILIQYHIMKIEKSSSNIGLDDDKANKVLDTYLENGSSYDKAKEEMISLAEEADSIELASR